MILWADILWCKVNNLLPDYSTCWYYFSVAEK